MDHEFEPFEPVLFLEDEYWRVGFYSNMTRRGEHVLIGEKVLDPDTPIYPYSRYSKHFVGKHREEMKHGDQ